MSTHRSRPAIARPADPLRLRMFLLTLSAGVAGALFLLRFGPSDTVEVSMPRTNLPAYHVIRHTDLVTSTLKQAELPATSIRNSDELVGHYTLAELKASKPITSAQVQLLSDPALITNTVATGIPATAAMALGSTLKAGDTVDLVFASAEPISATTPSSPIMFQNLLVLDVKPAAQSAKPASEAAPIAFVIIVALPLDRREEFAARSPHSMVLVTRRTSP